MVVRKGLSTWAQNNTQYIKVFKEHKKHILNSLMQILAIAGRYRNPTSIWSNNLKTI
jgi:hypothetical protein